MRHVAWALILLAAACGSSSKAKSDGSSTGGEPRPIDGPMLPACANPVNGTNMSVQMIGRVSGSAILATSPPVDPRIFVIEQGGGIRVFDASHQLLPTPFLDISTGKNLTTGGEMGLLGLAFHPQYAQNGKFYIWYTATGNGTAYSDVLEQYTVSANDPNVADANSGQIVLAIPDKFSNHNGGMLEFGADGYLYIGTGDGGSGGDPDRNGQNPNALLAKILRIDVDHPAGGNMYGIPSTNPYAGGGGAPEVFMIGVRNPWRWSFDRLTGDMWIGDVGQDQIEELDVLKPGEQSGANLGWSMWEANSCYGNYTCTMNGMTFPKAQWTHSGTPFRAIIGGQVYRGSCYPDIAGYYFFSDNNAGNMERAKLNGDGTVTIVDLPAPTGGNWPQSPSSLHADAHGELYETNTQGYVFHLEAGP